MSNDKPKSDRPGDGKPGVYRLGGREIREGDSLTPEEAEEFIRRLIEESGGPVTMEEVDESAGTTVRSSVDDWSNFEQGPRLSEDHFESFRSDLAKKGYLAFERDYDGLKYHTAFRVLNPRYFADFDRFIRCQDIPASYFGPVVPGKSWFVSHRWATPAHPDPSRTQFEIVREFVHRKRVHGIWYDYSCMPQEPHSSAADRQLFADSLKHMNSLIVTTNFLSIESDDYFSRAWCYYERIICQLLCCSKRARVAPRDAPKLDNEVVNEFVVEGKVPALRAEKASDLPLINDLLVTGADMFKMLAVGTTFTLLNSFGFDFGVGTAARFSQTIDFGKFWMIWQVLAGSSEGSGIQIPHLLNADRLRTVLTQRHERFGTHARFFADLRNQMSQPLDMRIVEQASASRLATLMKEVRSSGPVPGAFSKLAMIQLVYWIAGRDQPSPSGVKPIKTEKQRKPLQPRSLRSAEVLVLFALDAAGPEVDDDWFDAVFNDLASEWKPQGVWFGSWKVLRVPDMRIEAPGPSGGALKLPGTFLDELQAWDAKQHKPDSAKLVRIRKYPDIRGYAFVVRVPEESVRS